MAIVMLLWATSSCRISHLGMNPVNGGRPPSDSRVSMMIRVIGVDLFHRLANDLIFVVDVRFSDRKRVSVAEI